MTLDQLLDEARQFIAWADQAEPWDRDTYDTAIDNALHNYREIDKRLRAGEALPTDWRTGR